ncbi:MAG: cation:proton antiporter [Gordonia sp. (in: high G+C Gram-positive bacteria)]
MLGQLALLLGSALLFGAVARRLGLPSLSGELFAGVVLGPSILGGLWPEAETWLLPADGQVAPEIAAVGKVGILILVCLAGTELNVPFLRSRTKVLTSVSAWAFALPLAAGFGVGLLVPARFHGEHATTWLFALLLGTAMAVSAVPVIARILVELKLLRTNIGQLILASGTLTDIAAWLVLAVVSALAVADGDLGHVGWMSLWLVLMLIGVVVVRPLVGRVLDRLQVDHPAQAGAALVVAAFTGAAIAGAAGLEPVLGAFFAGLVVGNRSDRVLAPLNAVTVGVLAPVFLVTAGLRLDVARLGDPATLVLSAVLLVVAVGTKILGGFVGARLAGAPRWESAAIGSGLNARGLMEIILASVGLQSGLFGPEVFMVIVLVAVLTSAVAPSMLTYCLRKAGTEPDDEGSVDVARVPARRDVDQRDSVTPNAASTVRNFAAVSASSAAESDSATIPPPA